MRVYIFIGPPSSGKSYLGKKYAQYKDFTFFEADDYYLPEYRERVKISSEEREKVYEEFYSVIINKIKEKLKEKSPVVVASAIGRERNRKRFIKEFGKDVCFVYIKSPVDMLINNAINNEFPKLQGVKELTDKEEISIRKHLEEKYNRYEIPENAIVIDNDYTDESFNKVVDALERYC